jgi:hypothetical protein
MARPWRAALPAALVLVACSHAGSNAAPVTTTASAGRAPASGASVPTVATTAIPGAPAPAPAPPAGGTSAPVATTTIPLAPPSSSPGAPAASEPAAPDTTAPSSPAAPSPGSSTTPPSSAAGGDAAAFCRAVDDVLPLYLTTLILVDSGDGTDGDTRFEVAVAPSLTAPVHAAATNAPGAVGGPFQRWAARADAAVAALKGAGATDAQVTALAAAVSAQVDRAVGGDANPSPPDPVEAAARAGIDAGRLGAATSAFTAANGDFDTFAGALGQDLDLAPGPLNELAAQYPCAGELASFSG